MGPRIDHYDWDGGREALLRFGPEVGPIVVLALPLFEEANRTRTFAVALLRALAARGIAGLLPDVPGQNESLTPLAGLTLADMQAALAGVAPDRRTYGVGIRSGALLDTASHRRWHFAPQTGARLIRLLHRTWRAAGNRGPIPDPVEIAGNCLPAALLASLAEAVPHADRIVRLAASSLGGSMAGD